MKLRLEYQSCIKLADETDSKREDRVLRAEAETLLTQLKESCPHEDVILTQSSYEGNQCMDYDDAHPEHRLCLCCGVEEKGKNRSSIPRPDTFEILISRPFARFESSWYARDPKVPIQVRECLKFLLSEVIGAAREHGYRVFT